ncbi:hypothetical protein Vadar_025847 [Vaccinium darrowii]|uniref:Uncharacterized protein n=1 Tax=Vaccinium darrowii TaxID=229202 RepID=A0ACB7XUT5_9ERIC|nr:hypothetical protein Vadar_025847 [Vaccinium darrowii]
MTATVLLPAAQAILNVLIPLVTQQINLAWGFKGDLIKLKRRLKNIQAMLRDAERGQVESEALKEWLKSLKSATCDAENVLGEFAYEAFRRKLEVGNRRRTSVEMTPLKKKVCECSKINNCGPLIIEDAEAAERTHG